jgi:hypothetical protein
VFKSENPAQTIQLLKDNAKSVMWFNEKEKNFL